MHILIATPLYPPDIAGHAPYVKELAKRLSSEHKVTVLLYGDYPEDVPGVRLVTVSKQQPAFIRLWKYALALFSHAKGASVVYIQNGPSVELPMVCAKILLPKKPFIMHVSDSAAFTYTNRIYSTFFKLAVRFSSIVYTYADVVHLVPQSPTIKICTRLRERPEILPFAPYPETEFTAYNTRWEEHIQTLTSDLKTLCRHTS
jgi:hypothetical protein